MSRNAVIFNELTPQLQGIIGFFRGRGTALAYAVDGKDAFELIKDKKPAVAIIGVAMPGMSGVEISRRIKIEENQETAIVIISDLPNESIRQRALDAGCDLYLEPNEQLESELYTFVQKTFKMQPRLHLRVRIAKDIIIIAGDKKIPARSINLSMSGILIITQENLEMGQVIKVFIRSEDGNHLQIDGLVARTVEIPDNGGTKTGLGIKFTAMAESEAQKLESLIESIKMGGGYSFEGKKIDLKPLIDLFLMEDAFFAEYLGSLMSEEGESASQEKKEESSAPVFDFYFPKLQGWEIAAFAGGDERSEIYLSLIRKMVMLFVKFENISRVLNDVPYCDDEEEKTLLNTLESLFEVGTATENSVEELLKSGESFGVAGLMNKITKTKRKYVDAKIRLLKGIAENYEEVVPKKPSLQEIVTGFAGRFQAIKNEFEELKKEFAKGIEERKEITKEKDIRPGKKDKPEYKKHSKTVAIAGSILVFVATLVFLYSKFLAGTVDVNKYATPGVVKSGRVLEGVLNLVADDNWNIKRDKNLTREVLEDIYRKVRADNILRMKLVDSSGKVIGMVVVDQNRKHRIVVF